MREKIIKALRIELDGNSVCPGHGCPYEEEQPQDCFTIMMKDMLAYLEDLETTVYTKRKGTLIGPFHCHKCNATLAFEQKYCHCCGRKVMWDDYF